MSFSKKILVGLLTGIATGIILGDYVAPLSLVADGFVRLLQMTVLPYVTVSIVLSVGSLDVAQAKRLGLRVGLAIAGLWVVALIFAFLFPLVFPPAETAAFFSASLIEKPATFDFVNLYIPSNPFHSLANNIVPAVVLFLDETAAFIVRDHLRGRFETWSSIQETADLSIGIPSLPYYARLLKARLPGLPMRSFQVGQDPLADSAGFDAVAMPAERGSVLTLLNPKWTVVVPSPGLIKIPLAFPLAGTDPRWSSFVNTWIDMKRRDGTLDALYDHWILGKDAEKRTRRWSVVRNVLHWGR